MEENSIGGGRVGLDRAEELIAEGKPEEAQAVLDGLDEKNGEWHYVQARLYIEKNWLNEARKQLEIAMREEPENAQYIEAYDSLKYRAEEEHAEGEKIKKGKRRGAKDKEQMGSFCAECCCESCAFGCAEGLCESACDGCG